MFLQSVDVLDRVKVFYQIVGALGVILQSILLVSHRKEIKRLLADMQRFISLSKILIPNFGYMFLTYLYY